MNLKVLHPDIEQRVDGTLLDVLDDVLRTCHLESVRCFPDATEVLNHFPAAERETTLMWLFQVCAALNFQDAILHTAVILLDRFCASLPRPLPTDRLQLVTVAVLGISVKMIGAADDVSKPPKLKDLLLHLGQHHFTIQEIYEAEHEVLRILGWAVSMPTAVDLLDSFLLPHGLSDEVLSPVRCLAKFLLQLSLVDASLHYRFSHAVLAAGAVYVALWCTQSGPDHVSALLHDVAACIHERA